MNFRYLRHNLVLGKVPQYYQFQNILPRKSEIIVKKILIWMNKDALSKLKQKMSYHRYLRTNDQRDYKTYTKSRNQSKRACRKTIAEYEKFLSREVKTNPKAFFKHASSKLNYSGTISDPKDGNKIVSENCQKAKSFNMFFTSVFTKETNALPQFRTPSENTIDSISFTLHKVRSKLKELNTFKSSGVNRLRPRILKELSEEISTTLSIIFTKSFIERQLPQNWKGAIVTPLRKK